MRKLGKLSGFGIMLFLITAVPHYKEDNFATLFISLGALFTGICLIVVELRVFIEKKEKKKGYILRA